MNKYSTKREYELSSKIRKIRILLQNTALPLCRYFRLFLRFIS